MSSIFDYNHVGRELSPFLLMDYAAPHSFPAGSKRRGVAAHPHKGFETVTLVYQGELEHRDSTGAGGIIGPGDVQWMTAGDGIIHEEFHSSRFSQQGGILEMIQLWVNLPAVNKGAPPCYQTLLSKNIPIVELEGTGGKVRIIAGELCGIGGAARTFTPINLWDISIPAAGRVDLPVPCDHSAALYVLAGGAICANTTHAEVGDLVVFSTEGDHIAFEAARNSRYLFLGGQPIFEPIVGQGPFVMNTQKEIEEAFSAFKARPWLP